MEYTFDRYEPWLLTSFPVMWCLALLLPFALRDLILDALLYVHSRGDDFWLAYVNFHFGENLLIWLVDRGLPVCRLSYHSCCDIFMWRLLLSVSNLSPPAKTVDWLIVEGWRIEGRWLSRNTYSDGCIFMCLFLSICMLFWRTADLDTTLAKSGLLIIWLCQLSSPLGLE